MHRTLHSLLFSLAFVLACGTALNAQATILTFNIDTQAPPQPATNQSLITTHPQYGDNVSSLSQVVGPNVYNYAQGNAFTPNVTVAYSVFGADAGNSFFYTDGDGAVSPAWKDVNFLQGGGAASVNRFYRYTFVPTSPFGVDVNSFDLFRYIGSDTQNVTWTLYKNFAGGPVIASANTGNFNTTHAAPLTVVPNADPYFGTVVLEIQHLVGSGGGFGLDNLNFDQAYPVPEPATGLLLGLGLVGLAVRARRRRLVKSEE